MERASGVVLAVYEALLCLRQAGGDILDHERGHPVSTVGQEPFQTETAPKRSSSTFNCGDGCRRGLTTPIHEAQVRVLFMQEQQLAEPRCMAQPQPCTELRSFTDIEDAEDKAALDGYE